MASTQLHLDIFSVPGPSSPRVAAAVEALANQSSIEARGAIFTRAEVVDFILDLAGYTEDRPLHRMRFLEPSFGGEFLLAAVSRLLAAWRNGTGRQLDVDQLRGIPQGQSDIA